MIIDSYIWKYELKKEINEIVFFFDNADFNDDSEISHLLDEKAFIKLQKFTIYTSIIIRKLIEAHKISFELLGENFSIISYQKNPNEKITYWNSFEIEKIYHLDTPVKVNISIKDLVDKIIHSFHFMPKYNWQKIDVLLPDDDIENWTNEGFEGFYFSSDKSKNKDLLFISFEKYVEILKNISTDFIIRKTYEGDKIVLNSRTKEK
ncbi:hypothetical protein [Flavobacterium sp. 14A]|uniref:hypothetical protein n=1 Tax=Flavobacterium sp. 14A TaxID=2735896 RepID=UPI00156EC20C|nr:hypothetical protein [Flavobacterium sp. 14A]NRT12419.1 hypothetical protein [Flavobacterium sp. 14A]